MPAAQSHGCSNIFRTQICWLTFSEKYIRLVVHILVLIHRARVSDSGTNYSKFSQEAVKRGVHSLHKEVPLWLGIVDGINNSTHCMLLCPTPPSNIMTTSLLRTGGFAPVNFLSLSHNCIAFGLSKGRNSFWMGSAPQMESNLSWQKSRTQKFCVVPLAKGRNPFWMGSAFRWNPIYHGKKAGPRNSGLCPSEGRNPFYPGIFYASAIKKNSRICLKSVFPVILITLRSFSVLKGGTHSILAKRRN